MLTYKLKVNLNFGLFKIAICDFEQKQEYIASGIFFISGLHYGQIHCF